MPQKRRYSVEETCKPGGECMSSPASLGTLETLHSVVDRLSRLANYEDIFEFVMQWLQENTQAKVVGLAQCDQDTVLGKIISVKADRRLTKGVEMLLGHPLIGSPIKVPSILRDKSGLNYASWTEHVYPLKEPFNVGMMFGLQSVYGYPIPFQGTTLVIGLVMGRGQSITPQVKLMLELVLKQVTLALRACLVPPQINFNMPDGGARDNTAVLYIENGTVIHCTDGVSAIFGWEPHQIINRKIHTWLPEVKAKATKESVKTLLHAIAQEGKSRTMDINLNSPKGTRTIEMHLSPLRFPAGKIVVHVTATDVTDKRQIEKALLESE